MFDFVCFSFNVERYEDMSIPTHVDDLISAIPGSKFEDCNLARAEEFFRKNPPENVEESKKFQRNARQILARAKQYLDDLGIPFWLSSGTCLGLTLCSFSVCVLSASSGKGVFSNTFVCPLVRPDSISTFLSLWVHLTL